MQNCDLSGSLAMPCLIALLHLKTGNFDDYMGEVPSEFVDLHKQAKAMLLFLGKKPNNNR